MPETTLKRLLDSEGRRQNWLSGTTGIARQRMSYIVNGLHPSEAERDAIARALGRTLAEVFPDFEDAA